MNDLPRIVFLVFCGLSAFVLLIIAYVWYFVFGSSLQKLLLAGVSILLNRDSRIDLNADPKVVKRPKDAKSEMPQEAQSLDFQESLTSYDEYIPQMATDDSDGFGAQSVDVQPTMDDFVSSSFETGRFRRVKEAISRPFLKMRITQRGDDVPAQNVKRGGDSSQTE